jgi:hypothetical protein
VGSFAQVTYSAQGNHFSWDNTDIRYANSERQLLAPPGRDWWANKKAAKIPRPEERL